MIVAKHTPKNEKIIDEIANIEMDLQMFGNYMDDDEFDRQIAKLHELYAKIEK